MSSARDDEDEVIMLQMAPPGAPPGYGTQPVPYPFHIKQPTEKFNRLFLKYKGVLENTLGESVISIDQMGSGAIPGMPGTHMIDIIVSIKNYPPTSEQLDALKSINVGLANRGNAPHDPNDTWMVAHDFPPQGDFEEFKVDGKFPPLGRLGGMVLHLVHYTNPFLVNSLAYAEYLKVNESAFKKYRDVKVQGAKLNAGQNAEDSNTFMKYKMSKVAIVKELMVEALAWKEKNGIKLPAELFKE